MPTYTYSLLVKIVFWLLWMVAFLVFLLFAFLAVATAIETNVDLGLMSVWNGLIALAELVVLFMATRYFIRKDIPSSKLLLWITGAAVGLPLLASGGCIMLDSMGAGFRIAG
jgi:hypothetical protein